MRRAPVCVTLAVWSSLQTCSPSGDPLLLTCPNPTSVYFIAHFDLEQEGSSSTGVTTWTSQTGFGGGTKGDGKGPWWYYGNLNVVCGTCKPKVCTGTPQCTEGACCDTTTCNFKFSGAPCRAASNDCDEVRASIIREEAE